LGERERAFVVCVNRDGVKYAVSAILDAASLGSLTVPTAVLPAELIALLAA